MTALYAIASRGEIIGHSGLECGDPPMGVAFGRFLPAVSFDAFVRTVPPDMTEGDGVLVWNALSAMSPDGIVVECSGVAVFRYAFGDEIDHEVTVLGIASLSYGQLFPHHVDASGDRAIQGRSASTSLAGPGPSAYSAHRRSTETGMTSEAGRTPKQKMIAGELYHPDDAELGADLRACQVWLARYNAMLGRPADERRVLLREIFARVGDGAVIRPPFHCDYGYNISIGAHVFLNFNCVILDCTTVTIGDRTQIGPGVQILTADHPREAEAREAGLEFARPIAIGRNVWIGGGALILPGVTVGDHAIIGAGAVVTRDVAPGATVVGNPARPVPAKV